MATSERIRALRKAKDVTQQELADSLKMNQSVVNRIERGTRPVRDDELKALARYFGVTTDYLLDNDVPDEFDSETVNMLKDYRMLDAANRQMISRLVSALWAQQQAAPA